MRVSELKEILNDLDENAEIDGIYVRPDIVQVEDDMTRYSCNLVTLKGASKTITNFKYVSYTAPFSKKDKKKEEPVKNNAFTRFFKGDANVNQ